MAGRRSPSRSSSRRVNPAPNGETGDAGAAARLRRLTPGAEFLQAEAGGGTALLAATIAALIWANSPWRQSYADFWHTEFVVGPGWWAVREDLVHWVNDALMAVFFFLVGLEIKREVTVGELRDPRAATLPAVAALGGMALPALLFLAVAGGGEAARGWAIPMATDIAFAVGVLALLGRRVPSGLKAFLLTLAIVDDIGAIAVIAVFYSKDTAPGWLLGTAATLVAVVVARSLGLSRPLTYLPLGVAAWYCTYRAGIHPTIAAVALGLLTPTEPVRGRPVLTDLEHRLHPWSSYLIVPVFALANAGVPLSASTLNSAVASRLTWAVVVGLAVGKIVGISAAAWAAVRTRVGRPPADVRFGHLTGAGGLGGIGFTVSLFVTGLAFTSEALQREAKIGILLGSLLAAAIGVTVLLRQPVPAGNTPSSRNVRGSETCADWPRRGGRPTRDRHREAAVARALPARWRRADWDRMRLRAVIAWAGQTPLRRAVAALASLVAVVGIGLLDYATGSGLSFAVFYVLVVIAVTVVAGAGIGILAALWSAAVWSAADSFLGHSETGIVQVGNLLVRFTVHGIVVLLVTALLRALRAARESEARSRSFLAAAAHQLRTPVAALSASAEALLLEGASPGQERLLANVAGEASRLGRLVASLLRTARLDQGEALRPQVVDVVELCEREIDRARQLSDLEWRLVLDRDRPLEIVLDADATRESIGNLLDNARRHARTAVEVRVHTERMHVVAEVVDDGPGLPSGAEARAFERFVTLDGQGGTGLGLAIARELARRQGGDLVYHQKAFVLTLPLVQPHGGGTDGQPAMP